MFSALKFLKTYVYANDTYFSIYFNLSADKNKKYF